MSKAAVVLNKLLKIHIKLDTGMTRIGYRHIQDAILEIRGNFKNFQILNWKVSPILPEQMSQILHGISAAGDI